MASPTKTARWYFDVVSPYAYLQSTRLAEVDDACEVAPVPILFAGLLNHNQHLGPAEIPGKRVFTYRQIVWLAHRDSIPLKFPAGHPFNPLSLLRLSIACGNSRSAIERIFAFVWQDGHTPADEAAFAALLQALGVTPAELDNADVKAALRANTDQAIAAGVFGVPTLEIDGQLFWGYDSTEMALAYCRNQPVFDSPTMERVETLPELVTRRR